MGCSREEQGNRVAGRHALGVIRCGLGTYENLVFLFVLKSTIWIFFFADKLVFVFDIKPKMGESAFYIHLVYK